MLQILLLVVYPQLAAAAQDRALTCELDRVVVSESGRIVADCRLKYDRRDPGPLLSWLCPQKIEIPGFGLPWTHQCESAEVYGIPTNLRSPARFFFSILSASGPNAVLESGAAVAEKMDLTDFFAKGFAAQYRNAEENLNIGLAVKVTYETRLPGLSAFDLPKPLWWAAINDFRGPFSTSDVGFRSVTLTSGGADMVVQTAGSTDNVQTGDTSDGQDD